MAALRTRHFRAYAKPMPGSPDGPHVLLVETSGRSMRERVLTLAEAEEIRAELAEALRCFAVAKEFTEGPVAATDPCPFGGQRTLAEVDG